ncbi:arabinosyltransferase domain-containing protein [Saccharopolyspora taberi]|uniref:Arabinosyltransferase domain-containing protein n=1 Tax=Saccharopolyspora taberi TaxID=60895 RepID=A0ABN3VNZ6_9PSEU
MKLSNEPVPLDSVVGPAPERPVRTAVWLAHAVALVVGAFGLVCALALPFAPVWSERTEVRWPTAEAEATTAFLAPYRPAEFAATVPCRTVREAAGTVFTTLPPGSDREGMVLAVRGGKPELLLGQRSVPLPALSGDCTLTVHADSTRSVVAVGGWSTELQGIAAPEIFTFGTDLPPAQAATLSVTARTFSWFDTAPTELKQTLITCALVCAVLSALVLLARTRPRIRFNSPLLMAIDAAMLAILALWLVIGPISDDDGFAMLTVRNYEPSGDIGNYYRWFNASETPFTLVQHLMRWVSDYSLAPVWLRFPSIVAGLLTWVVVSRGIVGPMCRAGLKGHALAAVFFLACWLPFGLGVRPEAFVSLGMAVLVACLLKADRSDAPLGWLGLAAITAGLTAAVTPTGVAALIVVVAFAPRILRVIARPGPLPRWAAVPTRLVLLGCAASVGLVAMFADSTWNGVLQATAIHHEFGPSLGWYQEIDRYAALLGTGSWGAAGKRLAVFLVLTAVLLAGGCVLRRVHRWTRMSEVELLLGAVAAVLAGLWLTPSKWTHHFGSLAGVGSALLAVTVVMLWRVRVPREARMLGIFGLLAASVAAGLAFMGPNAWYLYSDIAMPWSDTPVRPLDEPLLWLAFGVVAGCVGFAALHGSGRPAWTAMPSSVLVLAALASTLVLLTSFVAAPRVMGDRFSVAQVNRQSLTATSCGIEDEVETLPFASALRPLPGVTAAEGFAPGGPPPPEPELDRKKNGEVQPVEEVPAVWDSRERGPQTVGSLATTWFELPPLGAGQVLSLWVSGRPEQGNSLAVEFATPGGAVRRELRDPPPTELPFDDPRHGRPVDWRDFRPWRVMTVDDVPPGASRVRVLAEDATADEQGWLAVSAPVVRNVVPLREVLDEQEPALIDWPMGLLFPCRTGYPRVGGGSADSPGVLVAPPGGEGSMAYDPEVGGVFAGVPMLSWRLETPSRLRGAPGVSWGHVYSVSYDVRRDLYERGSRRGVIGGAGGDGGYPFEEH